MNQKPLNTLGITILGSGSSGNATVLQTPGEALLIDAGFSVRQLRRRLSAASIPEELLSAILVSHEHSDHTKGLRVCAEHFGIPIYANSQTAQTLRGRDAKLGRLHLFASGNPFAVGSFVVEPFSIPHDANDPVAFVIRVQGLKIGIATDLGYVSRLVSYQLQECDALVLESNHDLGMLRASSRPWSLKQRIMGRHGHLSNESGLELLRTVLHARTRHVALAHASAECNRYDLVKCGAEACLAELGRNDVALHVAEQDRVLPTFWL